MSFGPATGGTRVSRRSPGRPGSAPQLLGVPFLVKRQRTRKRDQNGRDLDNDRSESNYFLHRGRRYHRTGYLQNRLCLLMPLKVRYFCMVFFLGCLEKAMVQ